MLKAGLWDNNDFLNSLNEEEYNYYLRTHSGDKSEFFNETGRDLSWNMERE